MVRLDPHSWTDSDQPQLERLAWRAAVDFDARVLRCEATLMLHSPVNEAGPLDLDTRDLRIQRITDDSDRALNFSLGETDAILGARLRIDLPAGASEVHIVYETSPDASAMQWLEAAQTSSGGRPFLYSQCQPTHARSVVPIQDTPTTRLRYTADLRVPAELTSLMAARHLGRELDGPDAVEHFEMPQPISPYLFAFAIGELVSRDLSPRCRVWAEPARVESAAAEFADVETMLQAGERLFFAYPWERYDLLVLPPSFPYGGMENPRLTFLTPTVIVGDRSATDVIAHELAHSWTGNLVSNANADHFWLNEGFTTYAERRIVEVVFGQDVAALNWALGRRELDDVVAQFTRDGQPELTRLRTSLNGVDPDVVYSIVPYEKGALFLWTLEESIGRSALDGFLRTYLDRFRFQAVTTEQFVATAEELLPGALEGIDAQEWVYGAGVPENARKATSERLERIERLRGAIPSEEIASRWRPLEWQIYLGSVAHTHSQALDERFHLTQSGNYDILEKWLPLAIRAGYAPGLERAAEVLGTVGRIKYLRPLFRALAEQPATRDLAQSLFTRYEERYHPIARLVIAQLLASAGQTNGSA